MSNTRLYLINPASDFPTYFGGEVFASLGLSPGTYMADLAMTTVAAFAPADFHVRLVDEHIDPIDFDCDAEYVGITGKVAQQRRMVEVASEFRRRGRIVIFGGPAVSLSPESFREHCDILVRGEIENIAGQLFADLRDGCWQEEYIGDRPELDRCPVPRWDLYSNDRALVGTVQSSRGCPFECEFCDVIQYLGRKQRHKPFGLLLAELDELYKRGYRRVFIADDNFTVYRARARETLLALAAWNDARSEPVDFVTQVSIDAARDEDLLELCARAGLTTMFIGIETPNEASLRESKKRQNLKLDLLEQIEIFLSHGIHVTAGMIVGFDNDDASIFQRQYDFAMMSPVPIFSLGALVAPAATPLHARMEREGRVVKNGSEVAAVPWSTNIIPRTMTQDQLLSGVKTLCNAIYEPEAFGQRLLQFIETVRPRKWVGSRGPARSIDRDTMVVLRRFKQLGPVEERVWVGALAAAARKPETEKYVAAAMFLYLQIRHMYDRGQVWEPMPRADTARGAGDSLIQLSRRDRIVA